MWREGAKSGQAANYVFSLISWVTQFAGSATPLLSSCWYFSLLSISPPFSLSISLSLITNKFQLMQSSLWPFQQVAATADHDDILGMIRGCIKTVTCGKKLSRTPKTTIHHAAADHPTKYVPVYTKLAYILGLRVSPAHRYVVVVCVCVCVYIYIYIYICMYIYRLMY